MSNLRLFVGIDLPPPVQAAAGAMMERLAERLPFRRWTHPEDLHITLHFLGDTPEDLLEPLMRVLANTAARTTVFPLMLSQPGTFGPPDAPRVLWLGLAEPDRPGALAALQQALVPGLAAAGFALDNRPYRPHVTLARQGGPGCRSDAIREAWEDWAAGSADGPDERSAAAAISSPAPLAWTADRLTLFRTHFGRKPSYERIAEYPFSVKI